MRPTDLRRITLGLFLAGIAAGQAPEIGIIDVFGARKVSQDKIRAALGVKPGDRLPASKGDIEERLEEIPGIVRANLEAACCEDGKAILYVGIEEKGASAFELRDPPSEAVVLPLDIHHAYHHFVEALGQAVRKGEIREDLSRGHSLIENTEARAIQEAFVELANKHLETLRRVLRSSADEEARAIAAYMIGYASDKRGIVNDLQFAMRDADATVRANAMRALVAVATYARLNPDEGIRVQFTWFVEMLNSIYFTDRHSAAVALATFTEKRDPALLDHLRERASTSLAEMARWKHLPHALPAFILAGRVAGLDEKEIQEAWNRGDRESVIAKLRASTKR